MGVGVESSWFLVKVFMCNSKEALLCRFICHGETHGDVYMEPCVKKLTG